MKLFNCYSCGYNVYHDGWSFLYKKDGHVPNMTRNESHEYYGEIMKAQQNYFTNASGMSKGCEIYLNQKKAAYNGVQPNTPPFSTRHLI